MHSTAKIRPFLSMFNDIRFSSLPILRSLFFGNETGDGRQSRDGEHPSVELRFLSEIRLAYCVNRLFTRISSLRWLNTPKPSCEIWRWVISFSRLIYRIFFCLMQTFVNRTICWDISPSLSFWERYPAYQCLSVHCGRFFMANCCNLVIDIPNLCVNR